MATELIVATAYVRYQWELYVIRRRRGERDEIRVVENQPPLRLKGGSLFEQVQENMEDMEFAERLRYILNQSSHETLTPEEAQELFSRATVQKLLQPLSWKMLLFDLFIVCSSAAISGSIIGAVACLLTDNVMCPQMTQTVCVASIASAFAFNLYWNLVIRRCLFYKIDELKEKKSRRRLQKFYSIFTFLRFFAPSLITFAFSDIFGASERRATALAEYWRAWGVLFGFGLAFFCCCSCCCCAILFRCRVDLEDYMLDQFPPAVEVPEWQKKNTPTEWDNESRRKFLQEYLENKQTKA